MDTLDMLAILEQNLGTDWATVLGAIDITPDRPVPQPDVADEVRDGEAQVAGTIKGDGEDGLATFSL